MPCLLRLEALSNAKKCSKSLAYGRGDVKVHNNMVLIGIGHRHDGVILTKNILPWGSIKIVKA